MKTEFLLMSLMFMAATAGAAITGVETTVNDREASYLTGKTSVTVDGAATVALTLATDAAFNEVAHTASRTATAADTLAFPLEHLCPGTTYQVRAVATDGNGVAVTNDSSFSVADGYAKMCYKPDGGKTSYPWDLPAKWFASPGAGAGTELNYLPSLGDNVFLYSSKNDVRTGHPPMTIADGVHAETKGLTIAEDSYAKDFTIGITIQNGGTLTNAAHAYIGRTDAGTTGAGYIKVEDGGEWTANKFVLLGNSSGTSRIDIAAGGRFNVKGELVVGNDHGYGVVTNAGTMNIYDLFVGNWAGHGVLENRGEINVTRKATFGRNNGSGDAFVHFTPGSVFNKHLAEGKYFLLGYQLDATLETEGTINFVDAGDRMDIGANRAGVRGRLVMDGGAVVSNLTTLNVGMADGTRGEVAMKGSSAFVAGAGKRMNVYVAQGERSTGELRMQDNATILNPNRFRIGIGGFTTGVVELAGHAVVSNINDKQVLVCAQTNTWASLTVADDARLCGAITNLQIGTKKNSWGELRLRGGSVSVQAQASASVWQLFVGYDDANGTHGRIRGWGRLVKVGSSELRLTTAGQFIADGEGAARDLDLSIFRTAGAGDKVVSNSCGSNGWYAVNGGRLFYPRTQNCAANTVGHPALGDHPTRNMEPQLVNALKYTMTTPPNRQYYHYVALYAPDRTDIPALPTGKVDRVQGVLRIGTSSSLTLGAVDTPPDPIAFAGCGFTLRYDAAGLDVAADEKPYRVRLYRHDGTADGVWTKLAEQDHDPASPLVNCLDQRFDSSSAAWNWGWFTVVAHRPEKGLTIIVR